MNIPAFRYQQVKDWLGKDFEGVIIFDEAHKAKNLGILRVGDDNKKTKKGKKPKKFKGPLVQTSYLDEDDDDGEDQEESAECQKQVSCVWMMPR